MNNADTSSLQGEKRCIFCGEPPNAKNKEHVIPKWLISLTGNPKRQWHLGVETSHPDRRPRRFAADQFQFPACTSCNERYSALEGRTKGYLEGLLEGHNLTAADWDDLLDWFDKVRIGLWLGHMMLNKDWPTPPPNFYIDQRVGTKDRCVLIYPNRPNSKGLVMSGASDPVFMHKPSSFVLSINGLIFMNISTELLLSKHMGFPYPKQLRYEDDRVYVEDYAVDARLKLPFLDFPFHLPQLGIYQTILLDSAMADADYKALTDLDSTATKIIPSHGTKTQICTFSVGEVKFHELGDTVEKSDLAESGILSPQEYVSQLFSYRQKDLDDTMNFFPDRAKFLMHLKTYNQDGIEQAQHL